MVAIVWFRNDLRVSDNPALFEAAKMGAICPLFILEEGSTQRPLGGASHWWLHNSLERLRADLGGLLLLRGDPRNVLPDLVQRTGARAVFWNRRYDPEGIKTDRHLKARLSDMNVDAKSFNASLLFEPWTIETNAGGSFKVFSAFWRRCQDHTIPAALPKPTQLNLSKTSGGEDLHAWDLLPRSPDWAKAFSEHWSPGESGAQAALDAFFDGGILGYGELRNRPDLPNVSRLSPHLRFGEVSPRQIWHQSQALAAARSELHSDLDKFRSELGWREFSNHLLFHAPEISSENLNRKFDAYPWVEDAPKLRAWQMGMTGYPLVDAGMRELWTTGYMHNRVRMVVASFLTKHLRIHWREGEAWFWDTLLDADLANNPASWQWVAGSGADAAPYFRIFNPTTQAQKFDPDGTYIRRWCPEIAHLPTKAIHEPFKDPILLAGTGYPLPIVDHAQARAAALQGYDQIRSQDGAV